MEPSSPARLRRLPLFCSCPPQRLCCSAALFPDLALPPPSPASAAQPQLGCRSPTGIRPGGGAAGRSYRSALTPLQRRRPPRSPRPLPQLLRSAPRRDAPPPAARPPPLAGGRPAAQTLVRVWRSPRGGREVKQFVMRMCMLCSASAGAGVAVTLPKTYTHGHRLPHTPLTQSAGATATNTHANILTTATVADTLQMPYTLSLALPYIHTHTHAYSCTSARARAHIHICTLMQTDEHSFPASLTRHTHCHAPCRTLPNAIQCHKIHTHCHTHTATPPHK
jgi:hypothetical protein